MRDTTPYEGVLKVVAERDGADAAAELRLELATVEVGRGKAKMAAWPERFRDIVLDLLAGRFNYQYANCSRFCGVAVPTIRNWVGKHIEKRARAENLSEFWGASVQSMVPDLRMAVVELIQNLPAKIALLDVEKQLRVLPRALKLIKELEQGSIPDDLDPLEAKSRHGTDFKRMVEEAKAGEPSVSLSDLLAKAAGEDPELNPPTDEQRESTTIQ